MNLRGFALYLYAFLALPISFVGLPIYMHLPEYYSSVFGVNLVTIGLIMLCVRSFDTLTDPILGMLSNKFSKYQNRFIALSAIFLGIFFYFLFNPIVENKVINLIVFSSLTYLAFSLLSINHISYLSHFQNKVHISSMRETLTVFGLLLATVTPSILMLKFSQEKAFLILSIVFSVILVLSAMLFLIFNKGNIVITKHSHFEKISILKNRTLLTWFIFLLFNGFAIATPSTLILFYVKDFLIMQSHTGLFLFLYFISAICFIPIWNFAAKKIKILRLLQIGAIGSMLTFIWCYFLPHGNQLYSFYGFCAVCVFSGIFLGIDLIIPPVLTSVLIEKYQCENLKLFIFSITHFISKISVALVSGIILIALGQSNSLLYLNMLKIFYTIFPCIFKCIGLLILVFLRKKI